MLWSLSLQHLISPLNLRLTRSFGSKALPLCLQPSSTNGAWKGIEERWRVAVSVVVRRQHQPRVKKKSWDRSLSPPEACGTEGHADWDNAGVDVCLSLDRNHCSHTHTLGCWYSHVAVIAFLHQLWLKLMGHPCCWVAYFQSIYQMGWGCFSGLCAPRTLTVLEQSCVQPWRKVRASCPNKWYGLNDRRNDFYLSSFIWPWGWWYDEVMEGRDGLKLPRTISYLGILLWFNIVKPRQLFQSSWYKNYFIKQIK